ncbi:unnamed protein product, partial [Sphenostylis stenocarpa]
TVMWASSSMDIAVQEKSCACFFAGKFSQFKFMLGNNDELQQYKPTINCVD